LTGKKISVIGLGPGTADALPLKNWQILSAGDTIYFRTREHPAVTELEDKGIRGQSFDYIYQQMENFDRVYAEIVSSLWAAAEEAGHIIYAVPGHPLVGERTVQMLLAEPRPEIEVVIYPAASCLDALWGLLKVDPLAQGGVILDALDPLADKLNPSLPHIFLQVYNRLVAGDLKLRLGEYFPDSHPVKLVRAAGIPGQEKIMQLPLYEIDRQDWLDHLTSLYVPPYTGERSLTAARYPLDSLVFVMATLRGPEGCPWDKEQDHQTLKRYLIEEAYEVIEAIEEDDPYKLREELGDLLLQVVFHAQLAREDGWWDINDVVEAITSKMIERHPHVFGDQTVDDSKQVLINWEQIKEREKSARGQTTLMDIPRGMPALMRAEKVQKRAAKAGFDWPEWQGAWQALNSELEEFRQAITYQDQKEELGDLLFSVVNLARHFQIEPEDALHQAVTKFETRFRRVEQEVKATGGQWSDFNLAELDRFWERAKGNK